MTASIPKTVEVDIADRLVKLAESGGTWFAIERHKFEILRLCDQLQRVDVINASLFKANFYAMTGDRKLSEYWLENAVKNGAGTRAVPFQEACLFLLGHISEAYQVFDDAFANRGTISEIVFLRKALACGWFQKAMFVIEQSKAGQLPQDLVDLAKACSTVFEQAKISEVLVSQAVDEVHAILRDRSLLWLDNLPQITVSPESSRVHIAFRVEVSPEDAAEMNWQLIDRLIEKNLDSIGITFSFQGVTVVTGAQPEAIEV